VTRLAPILVAAVAALAASGCGGSNAGSVVSETTQNLGKIHSGVLDLKLMVTPHGRGEPFGFELKGPISLRPGKLPVARIEYTQTANGKSASATFVSDGTHAWVVSATGTRPLTAAQAAPLQGATHALSGSGGGGLSAFDVGAWLKHPKVSDGGTVGDTATQKVKGELDVVAAANGLMGFAALAGRNSSQIMGDDATRLQNAVRSSSVELLTGKADHLLRRLTMLADLGFDVPSTLKNALGTSVGAKVDFLLAVDRPNTPVVVHGP
jgi:hypothetical protein